MCLTIHQFTKSLTMSENTFPQENQPGTDYIFRTKILFAIACITMLLIISSVVTYCAYMGEEEVAIQVFETIFTAIISVYVGYLLGKISKKNEAEILNNFITPDQFTDKYFGKPGTPKRKKFDAGYEKFKVEVLFNESGTGKNELSSNT